MIGQDINRRRGAAKVIVELANHAQHDFDVTLAGANVESSDGVFVEIRKLPAIHRPNWLTAPTLASAAIAYVRREHFGVVHSHDTFSFNADLYTAHSSFKGFIERQRQERGHRFRLASAVYPPHVNLLAMSRLTLGRRGTRVVTVSKSVRQELLNAYDLDPSDVSVIYNAVDSSKYGDIDRMAARAKLGNELKRDLSGETVLSFVGHEFGRKRLGTTIRAMAASSHRGAIRLVVAGADDSTAYRRLAGDLHVGDRVHFLGMRSDVPSLMRAADVFAFPTQYEAASLAVLEAAAAGLAIVTTDVAMAAEVCSEGENALLIPNTDDPRYLAAAIDQVIDSPALAERLREGAQKLAAGFTWNSAWSEYLPIYEDIILRKRFFASQKRHITPRPKR